MKDPTVLHLNDTSGNLRKLERIHFLPGHSSINPDNITITQTYDLRYQIITTIRTEKGEMGFSIRLRLSSVLSIDLCFSLLSLPSRLCSGQDLQ